MHQKRNEFMLFFGSLLPWSEVRLPPECELCSLVDVCDVALTG